MTRDQYTIAENERFYILLKNGAEFLKVSKNESNLKMLKSQFNIN